MVEKCQWPETVILWHSHPTHPPSVSLSRSLCCGPEWDIRSTDCGPGAGTAWLAAVRGKERWRGWTDQTFPPKRGGEWGGGTATWLPIVTPAGSRSGGPNHDEMDISFPGSPSKSPVLLRSTRSDWFSHFFDLRWVVAAQPNYKSKLWHIEWWL